MTMTCFIRYRIDPFQREAFRAFDAAEKPFIPGEERTFLENVS